MSVTLKDKTVVEFKSLPKFREIAKYIEQRAEKSQYEEEDSLDISKPKGFGSL